MVAGAILFGTVIIGVTTVVKFVVTKVCSKSEGYVPVMISARRKVYYSPNLYSIWIIIVVVVVGNIAVVRRIGANWKSKQDRLFNEEVYI